MKSCLLLFALMLPVAGADLARDILKELVEIDTTDETGDTLRAAKAMAAVLQRNGFPAADVQVLAPDAPRKGNLVAWLRGSGRRPPLILLAHLDVVPARREDWSFDPFKLTEQEGYYYGRGTLDDKGQAAIWMANLIRYRQEGYKPDRDLVVALTTDEEGGDWNGVSWLLKTHPDLMRSGLVLNEGGGGELRRGKRLANEVENAQKMYLSFSVEVTNSGGHSSVPRKDNAIYQLAQGLARLAQFHFPVRLNAGTRTYFERMGQIETGPAGQAMRAVAAAAPGDLNDAFPPVAELSESPYYNALMRTTCVATRLFGGHADNALPQMARAVVNCRLLPDDTAETCVPS